ncbi:MAG TPA: APC family permease [Rubrobacteraceae bacterium]|nr:APC family permease [Rubrobacteraceae bacterium]
MEGSEAQAGATEQPHLRRGIGKWLLLFFIVGDMIGGGIYALVGEVGAVTGGAIWSAFLLASVLALLTAFAYTELVTKYPRAGGAATYVHNAYGMPFFSFMVAFAVVMSGVTSASALSIAFGGDYMAQFITVPTVLVALVFIVLVALINFRGISESVKVNATFTVIEVFGLLLIVLIGVVALSAGTGDPGRAFEFKGDASIPLVILAGAALSFYALIGFEDAVNVAEETQDPSRTFPRALFGGILLAAVIYLLVTFTASMVVPTDQLAGSSGPLLEVIRESPVAIPTSLFAVIALFAVANGALINMIMASRLIYGMSDQGVMPSFFRRIHPRTRTPWVAIVFTTLIAMALIAFGGTLENLASTTVLLLLLVFVIVNLTVLVLRRDPVAHEHFRAPIVFPILGLLVSAGMLTQQEGATWLRAAGLLLLGAVLYGVNHLVKRSLDRESPREE